MCILALLRRLGLNILPAGIISAFLMINFGMMTGMGTSTLRALVMFLLGILALCTGRTYDILSAVSVAAVLVLLEHPMYLYHSGFQLSFGAILGIGLVYPCLAFLVPQQWMRKKIIQTIAVSLSIQIATLPIVLYRFYQFPTLGILVNLVVVPLMTVVLALGFIGGLIGLLSDLAASLLLVPCRYILLFYEWISECSTDIPGSVWITGQPKLWQVALYYIVIFGVLIALSYIRNRHKYEDWQYEKRTRIICSIVMLTAVAVLIHRNREDFAMTMLSVGQGECTVIYGKDIPVMMIDGGSTDVSEVGKYRIIPYLKANRLTEIDMVFVSHTDTDHISGILEILQSEKCQITIKQLILPAIEPNLQNDGYAELISLAQAAEIPVYTMSAGDICVVGKNNVVTLTCLYPIENDTRNAEDMNESSMTLHINYVNLDALFTGDISSSVEERLIQTMPDCDILKVPHHGSRFSTCTAFLERIKPEIAFISAGKDNSYGHPHEDVLMRLKEQSIRCLRTDESGALKLFSDGKAVWIQTFR